MVEKRSETRATKQRFSRLSFHSALPINILCSFLCFLTCLMCVVRQRTVLEVFEHRGRRGKSNNSISPTRGTRAADLNC